MPTYSYACTECGHHFDAVQSFTDANLTECPACSGRLRKLFNSVGIVFKGSGFYRTDSRAGAVAAHERAEKGEKSGEKPDKGEHNTTKSDRVNSDGAKSDGAQNGSPKDGTKKKNEPTKAATSEKTPAKTR